MAMMGTGPDWARILAGVGGGLMQAGQPGGNFGQGLMQGTSFYDQGVDNRRLRAMQEARFKLEQEQADQTRLANTKAAELEKRRADFIASLPGGPQAGQMQTASGGMMQPGFNAQALELFPELQDEYVKRQLFPAEAKDNSTDDMREYQQAVSQGYNGNFFQYLTDLKKAGASNNNTTIYNKDYGPIPPGFRLVDGPNGATMEKVPGSPADEAATSRATSQAQTADVVTTDINRILDTQKNALLPTTGLSGGALSNLPGTAAYNVGELVSGIQANTSISKLNEMRQQSPTGGALGNVTEKENKMLADTLGSLSQSQDGAQFEYNLKRVYNIYLDIVHGKGNGPARYPLDEPAGPEGQGGWQEVPDMPGVTIRKKP